MHIPWMFQPIFGQILQNEAKFVFYASQNQIKSLLEVFRNSQKKIFLQKWIMQIINYAKLNKNNLQ